LFVVLGWRSRTPNASEVVLCDSVALLTFVLSFIIIVIIVVVIVS
jgi:hypothetical protein